MNEISNLLSMIEKLMANQESVLEILRSHQDRLDRLELELVDNSVRIY